MKEKKKTAELFRQLVNTNFADDEIRIEVIYENQFPFQN